MNRAVNFLLGAVIGGFIGAAFAILLAPSSGEELRAGIRMRT
ncbi:MAG: YtxH domain-containing protein, partial [Chloroflexota bacterium]